MVVWASTNNKGAIWARHESRHWGWGDNFSFIPASPARHRQRLARKQAQTQVTTRGTESQAQGMNHQLKNDSCQGMTEGQHPVRLVCYCVLCAHTDFREEGAAELDLEG